MFVTELGSIGIACGMRHSTNTKFSSKNHTTAIDKPNSVCTALLTLTLCAARMRMCSVKHGLVFSHNEYSSCYNLSNWSCAACRKNYRSVQLLSIAQCPISSVALKIPQHAYWFGDRAVLNGNSIHKLARANRNNTIHNTKQISRPTLIHGNTSSSQIFNIFTPLFYTFTALSCDPNCNLHLAWLTNRRKGKTVPI